jgi:putative membrane protein
LRRNSFLKRLLLAYVAFWIVLAIDPRYRGDWFLENLLVFAFAAGLVTTYRRYAFSNFSYLLIAIFLALHAIGAHSTYSETPIGDFLKRSFGLPRNPYDRIVHFAFGLLLVYPVREIVLRRLRAGTLGRVLVPLLAVLALSSAYEISESWVARIVSPELGTAYLGTQGDEWDAQKDMSLALSGALLGLLLAEVHLRRTGREPWVLLADRASRA